MDAFRLSSGVDLAYFGFMQTIAGQPTPVRGDTPSPRLKLHERFSPEIRPALLATVPPATPKPESPASEAAEPASNDRHSNRNLIETLGHSKVFKEFERAFTEMTHQPVALRTAECWQLPFHGKRHEAPYCAFMADKSRVCASCLQMQESLSKAANQEPRTMVCPSGLSETAVPVRLGARLIGFLQTGQVFRQKPTMAQFERTVAMVSEWGVPVDLDQMKEAYFATRVVSAKQQESISVLLKIFAQHLSMLSNQVVIHQENAEPPMVTKAKAYIDQNYTEELSLDEVARVVCTSPFYFCKKFKQGAGVSFTDYVCRVRIEKAKNLLLNPNLRISEIAYEVGFQSLTHFNRVFRQTLGQSPTEYRSHLAGVAATP